MPPSFKKQADRVLGLDFNTKSLAFCVFDERPVEWGKIYFDGADIYARMLEASKKSEALANRLEFDYVACEGAVRVNSQDTAIKMSLILGSILPSFLRKTTNLKLIKPIAWQSYIGNKPATKATKAAIKKANPDKSVSWVAAESRRRRKQYTLDFFNERWDDMKLTDDDVADACGLAYTGYHELTER
jgi:Holliday junction resolvasome RuvABC endonuclease subunit